MLTKIKDSAEKRFLLSNTMGYTKIPENVSDIRNIFLNSVCSIVQNIPKPKCIVNGSMVNISTEETIRHNLIIGSNVEMLCLHSVEEGTQSMENMIGYGKGLQNELIKISS